jgi:hypothetical protein
MKEWIFIKICNDMRHAVAQLVEAPSTSQKVAGSNPDGNIGIFHLHNLPGSIIALRSTNEYREYLLGGRAVKLTTFNLLKTSRTVTGISLTLCTMIGQGVITEGINGV